MQIKEAAAKCGLTEKAIRLYEEKGLITPTYTEINGRKFRDYDDETIEQLQTIAGLRQSFFSLDQIAAMQNTPEDIPAIFSEYRDELRGKFRELEELLERADAVVPESLTSADALAQALSGALSAPAEPQRLTDGTAELPAEEPYRIRRVETHAVPEMRFRVWDEDVDRDAREAAYQRYLEYAKTWEQSYDTELKLDKIKHFWLYPVGKFVVLPLLCLAVIGCFLYFVGWRTKVDITYSGYEVIFAEEIWNSNKAIFASLPEGVVPHEANITDFPKAVETKPTTLHLRGQLVRYLFRQDYFEGQLLADGFYSYDAFYRKRLENNAYRISLPNGILGTMGPYFFPERKTDDTKLIMFYSWGTPGSGEEQIVIPIEKNSNTGETAYLVFGAESADAASDLIWDRYWRDIQYQAWEADPSYYLQ